MEVSNLQRGKKLVWDATHGGNHHLYPVTVGIRYHSEMYPQKHWREMLFPGTQHWMGPFVKQLREPTEEELKTLTWREAKFTN